MITSQNKEIRALVDDISEGRLLLPELQRQFIWKSTQVRDLFDSLYHNYPSGQILVWQTDELPYSHTVNLDQLNNDQQHPQLLLDGQQRLTSLSAIMLKKDLIVRGSKKPIDIVFNVYTEKFEVSGPRQTADAGWISLTKLYTSGVLSILRDLKLDINNPDTQIYFDRLTRLENIKTYKYQVNILQNLNYDEVTHIFVRINSGGTKLSSADLALAQLSSRWRGITQEIYDYQWKIWKKGGHLWINGGILVRALSVMVSGHSKPSQLFKGERASIEVGELKKTWNRMKNGLDLAISFLSSNCLINRFDLLPTQYILIPLTVFFDHYGENISPKQTKELQRWVYLALVWMRYSLSVETSVDQDVQVINNNQPISALVQNIEDKVGKRRPITERELRDQRKNSPFMMMAYVLARKAKAQDWFNGVVIDGDQGLEFHHIFPKDVLKEKYDLKIDTRTVDQVANLAFLSKKANLKISGTPPNEYLPSIPTTRLYAQFVPTNQALWEGSKFEDFVLERRKMLATSINQLLQALAEEPTIWTIGDVELIELRIDELEESLRELVINRFRNARGDSAMELIPNEIRKDLSERRELHLREHPYDRESMQSLDSFVSFCQFSDYAKLIRPNWNLFKDDFGDMDKFTKKMKDIVEIRNAIKHNRDLPKSSLASGEAGLSWFEDCLSALVFNEPENLENGIEIHPDNQENDDEVK